MRLKRHFALRHLYNMTATQATFLFCTLFQAILTEGPLPEFLTPLESHTVTQGRDVYFTCVVNHLGSYKVAWIKLDTKAILAIHTRMVTQNPRLSVTYNGHNTWKLYILNVQKNDSGTYMCQINTDPMRSQMGKLEVQISPDILPDNEVPESMIKEGGNITLRCKATGVPEPTVTWRREDGNNIILRSDGNREKQVLRTYEGEVLTLTNIQRNDMGAYLCIAMNKVPPSVSKRFTVIVHFHPLIRVLNQLVAAPITSDVHVQCYLEASPKAMNTWSRDTGEKLLPSDKYVMQETQINDYSLLMNLTIKNLDKSDFGGYICQSYNLLGKAEAVVRLQVLEHVVKSTSTASTPRYIEVSHKKLPHSDKTKKVKQSKKKENIGNRYDVEKEQSTVFSPKTQTSLPLFTTVSSISRVPSWISLHDVNRGASASVPVYIMQGSMTNPLDYKKNTFFSCIVSIY